MSRIKEASEHDFMEATASTFEKIGEGVAEIKEALGEEFVYHALMDKCMALEISCSQCADLVRERAS